MQTSWLMVINLDFKIPSGPSRKPNSKFFGFNFWRWSYRPQITLWPPGAGPPLSTILSHHYDYDKQACKVQRAQSAGTRPSVTRGSHQQRQSTHFFAHKYKEKAFEWPLYHRQLRKNRWKPERVQCHWVKPEVTSPTRISGRPLKQSGKWHFWLKRNFSRTDFSPINLS